VRKPRGKGTATNLISTGQPTEDRAPSLTGLIPGGDWFSGQGVGRRVNMVEVELPRGGLLEELAASMAWTVISIMAAPVLAASVLPVSS